MPIGGLKEKLLAALRGGLKTVLIPKENERDLPEIPDNVKKGLEIVPVSTVDEVLARALVKPLTAIEWPDVSTYRPSPSSRPKFALTEASNRTEKALEQSGAFHFWPKLCRQQVPRPQNVVFNVDAVLRPPLHSTPSDFAGDRWVNKHDLIFVVCRFFDQSLQDLRGQRHRFDPDGHHQIVEEEGEGAAGRLRHLPGLQTQGGRGPQSPDRREDQDLPAAIVPRFKASKAAQGRGQLTAFPHPEERAQRASQGWDEHGASSPSFETRFALLRMRFFWLRQASLPGD